MQVGTYIEKMFKSELSGNVIGMRCVFFLFTVSFLAIVKCLKTLKIYRHAQ